ncbi:hypothetical protein G9A89_015241 [Geosiphon pyriformis]|nr:hypothetical protein G9A89_015241 [Geosiphon pyriformis]
MTSPQDNILFYSKYDLTNREGIAPAPHRRLIKAVMLDSWVLKYEGLFSWKEFTEYQVVTVYKTENGITGKSVVRKRYSEFLKFYELMCKKYDSFRLPLFPPKRFFGNTRKDFVNRRCNDLARFMQLVTSWRDNDVDVLLFLNIGLERGCLRKKLSSSSLSKQRLDMKKRRVSWGNKVEAVQSVIPTCIVNYQSFYKWALLFFV